jgi:hypothetical protein
MNFTLSSLGVYNMWPRKAESSAINLPVIKEFDLAVKKEVYKKPTHKKSISMKFNDSHIINYKSEECKKANSECKTTPFKKVMFDIYGKKKSNFLESRDEKLKKFKTIKRFPLKFKILDKQAEASPVFSNSMKLEEEYAAFKIGDNIELVKIQLVPPEERRTKNTFSEKTISTSYKLGFSPKIVGPVKLFRLLAEDEQRQCLNNENIKTVNIKSSSDVSRNKGHKRNLTSTTLTFNKCYFKTVCSSNLTLDASKRNFTTNKFILPNMHTLF